MYGLHIFMDYKYKHTYIEYFLESMNMLKLQTLLYCCPIHEGLVDCSAGGRDGRREFAFLLERVAEAVEGGWGVSSQSGPKILGIRCCLKLGNDLSSFTGCSTPQFVN